VSKAAAIATVRRSVVIFFFMFFQTSLLSGEGKGETATELRNRDDFQPFLVSPPRQEALLEPSHY
jgi:hypothetical protein